MASIKTSALVADIRGKQGGSVFSRNKGGAYVRQYVKPTNPNTTIQSNNRGLFGTLQTSWRSLTPAEQKSFIDAATNYPQQNKVGDTVFLSGAQLFSKVNMTLLASGLTPLTTIPSSPIALPVVELDLTDPLNFEWDWNVTTPALTAFMVLKSEETLTSDLYVQVYASPVVSKGINADSSTRRILITSVAGDTLTQSGNTWLLDVGPDWLSAYGLTVNDFPGEGKVGLEVQIFDKRNGVQRRVVVCYALVKRTV